MPKQRISRRTWLAAALAWPAPAAQRRRVLAGIEFDVIQRGPSDRRYLLIHGNEHTAREVLLKHMPGRRGRALLVTGQERWVTVRGLRLDPNRMFSREGAQRNLRLLNPEAGSAAVEGTLDWLDHERKALLAELLPPRGGLIVSMHNNASGYSLESEVGISDSVWLPSRGTPHDFMLATSSADFGILERAPFNALLQERPRGEDDGSLSRLCAARGIRYVNIEARIGHEAEQRAMLEWIEQHLP